MSNRGFHRSKRSKNIECIIELLDASIGYLNNVPPLVWFYSNVIRLVKSVSFLQQTWLKYQSRHIGYEGTTRSLILIGTLFILSQALLVLLQDTCITYYFRPKETLYIFFLTDCISYASSTNRKFEKGGTY